MRELILKSQEKMNSRKKIKNKYFILSITTIIFFLIINVPLYSYVMPADQLTDLMSANFSNVKSLIITQKTTQYIQNLEAINEFKEQVQMKAPDLFYSKILDQNKERSLILNKAYLQLLMANHEKDIEEILSLMGIDLQLTNLTRVNGKIAYQIGDKGEDSPKILIEKDSFLPLLLTYKAGEEEELITVNFNNYQHYKKQYYPFEIVFSSESGVSETYTIEKVKINASVDQTLLSSCSIKSTENETVSGATSSEGERLKKIIKSFEEKYQ